MCFLLLQQGTPYLNTSLGQSRVRPANTKHALLWAEKMKRWSRAALAYAGPCLFVFGLMETWHPRDILMEASTSPITCFHSVNMSLYLKDFISLPLPTVRRTYHETRCWKWRARLWKLESSWSQFWICCFGRFGHFGRWKDFDCFTKGLATSPPMAGTTNMESELWRWKVHVNFVDSVLHSGEREDGTKQSAQLQLARTVAICSIYSKLPPWAKTPTCVTLVCFHRYF